MDGRFVPETDPTRQRHRDAIVRCMGQALLADFLDPDVTDIALNDGDGRLYVTRAGQPAKYTGTLPASQATELIRAVAGALGEVVTETNPIVEGELDLLDGSRFIGILPPVTRGPAFAIRKMAGRLITLDERVSRGEMEPWQRDFLVACVETRRTILVVGSTGSGKTNLLNALLATVAAVHPRDRIVQVEDTRELQCAAENVITLRVSNKRNSDDETVTLRRLVRAALRLFPKWIVVGEVRGAEAFDLLFALNTGHSGMCSLHSDIVNPRAALTGLETRIAMAHGQPMPHLIGDVVDVIVCMDLTDSGQRRVTQIVSVERFDGADYVLNVEKDPHA